MLRYWCSGLVARWFGGTLPWGTLLVVVGGALPIGLVATLSVPDGRLLIGTVTRQFVMLGLLGGFTTFSSTLTLAQNGELAAGGGRHRRLGGTVPDRGLVRPRAGRRHQPAIGGNA